MNLKHKVIFLVPIASRTDEEGDGGDGGDGGEGRRRQGKRSEERERSRKGNSMPLSAVFGALLCIGIDGLFS